ncbi:MAG: SDR family oxidoreductase [Acidobacteria bacterium]|nr:SDR family oxidoreductase [Acidobacteriota bacterium]
MSVKLTLAILFLAYGAVLSATLSRAGHRGRIARGGGGAAWKPARILIVGATGGTGRQLVSLALERGHDVTALVRDPSRLPVEHPSLRVIRGDVLDPRAVEEAVRGQDAVVSALGHHRYYSPGGVLSSGTRNILRSMESHGVRRFVCETSLGIGDSAGRLGLFYTFFIIPAILPVYFLDKARQERIVARSRVDWVLVRPAVLTNGVGRGRWRAGARAGGFLLPARISRADVAAFMLDQLASEAYLGSAPGVCW